jgi:hypothetical protein
MKPDILGLLIPIIVIVMGLGYGMLAMYLNYRKRRDMFALYHQERMAAIEKGLELPAMPDDFFREEGKSLAHASHGTLLAGLILLFLGLTLYVALRFLLPPSTAGGGDVSLFAMIPGGIGMAMLIYYFTVGRKLAEATEEERKAKLAELNRSKTPPV